MEVKNYILLPCQKISIVVKLYGNKKKERKKEIRVKHE